MIKLVMFISSGTLATIGVACNALLIWLFVTISRVTSEYNAQSLYFAQEDSKITTNRLYVGLLALCDMLLCLLYLLMYPWDFVSTYYGIEESHAWYYR